jgi:integrase
MLLPLEENMATNPTPMRASPHHAYKSWTSTWYDDQGHRRTKRFGRIDEVTRKIATAKYKHWLRNEWEAKGYVRNPLDPHGYNIARLADRYGQVCLGIYLKRGKLTSHIDQVRSALGALKEHFGAWLCDDFGAPQLATLRDKMVMSADRHGADRVLSASTVNARLRIIQQMFRWARSYGLVSKETAYDVSLVPSLRVGRSIAKAPRKVLPVPAEVLDATLKAATPTIADMIRTMLLTGMRPGELCGMRACDIERGGQVWTYRPETHKTEHHDKDRVIVIGPQAQAILKTYIGRRLKLSEYVFLPEEAHRERLEQVGFAKVTAYQVSRSTFKPGRKFRADTFYGQINRTCDRAFDADGAKRAARDYSHRWNPHRLRHNAATRLREKFGIEAAADMLGHGSFNTAKIYAERSIERAKEIAAQAG